MSYVIVWANEYWLKTSEIILAWKEAEELVEYKDIFKKFLEKSKFNYQIELCKWTHRGKEEILYNKMETCIELIDSLDKFEKTYWEYIEKLANIQK